MANPARIAKGLAEAYVGKPRAAWPNSTAMYQRSDRMALQVCANKFMPTTGKPKRSSTGTIAKWLGVPQGDSKRSTLSSVISFS